MFCIPLLATAKEYNFVSGAAYASIHYCDFFESIKNELIDSPYSPSRISFGVVPFGVEYSIYKRYLFSRHILQVNFERIAHNKLGNEVSFYCFDSHINSSLRYYIKPNNISPFFQTGVSFGHLNIFTNSHVGDISEFNLTWTAGAGLKFPFKEKTHLCLEFSYSSRITGTKPLKIYTIGFSFMY